KPQTKFGRVFTIEDVPYVVVMGSGLMRIVGKYLEAVPGGGVRPSVGDSLEAVPGGELFKQDRWYEVLSIGGSLMVATSRALYRQTGTNFASYRTDADRLLEENGIYTCVALRNGDLAIGTVRGGLMLLDPAGH